MLFIYRLFERSRIFYDRIAKHFENAHLLYGVLNTQHPGNEQ